MKVSFKLSNSAACLKDSKTSKLAILKNWPLPGAVQVGQCSEERVDTPQCQPE